MTLKKTNIIARKVSVDTLRESVSFNPETGLFVWKTRPVDHFESEIRANKWNGKYAGKPAFTSRDGRGYARGCLNQCFLYAHRAAVALRDGEWPEGEIDHINRDKTDNRLCNLRIVSHRENRLNSDNCDRKRERLAAIEATRRPPKPAGLRKQGRRWAARIKRNKTETSLGSFRCFGKALRARKIAERAFR